MKDKKSLLVSILILLSLFFIAYKIGSLDKKIKNVNNSQKKEVENLANKITRLEDSSIDLKEKVKKILDYKEDTTNFEKKYNFEVINFNGEKVEIKLSLLPKILSDKIEIEIFNEKNNLYKLNKNNNFFERIINVNLNENIPTYANVKGLNNSLDETDKNPVGNNSTSRIFKLTPYFEEKMLSDETKYGDIVFDKIFYVYDKKQVKVEPKKITYNYDYTIKKIDKFRKSNFTNHTLMIEKNGKIIKEINLVEKNQVAENRFLIEGEIEATIKDKVNFIIKSKNEAKDEYITYLSKIENGVNSISGDTEIVILNENKEVYNYKNSMYKK